MSDASWLPGIVVLAAGLFIGLSLAFRMRSSRGQKSQRESGASDLTLKVRDLEARREDLYRRIRAADEDKLGAAEIAALEDAAALTLRELDQLAGQMPKQTHHAQAREDEDQQPAAAESTTTASTGSRNPLLVGFAFGAAMVAVVALLVYWAVEDAQPTTPMGTPMSSEGQPPHETQQEIPPEVAAQIADLENRLMTDPEDLMARKQLAITYVAAGQFVEAFSQASEVLAVSPEDPDGLLVHGIVRLTMGQADQAVGLLDQVLAQYPDHRQALIYRGLALYQTGRVEQALDTWDMGLQLAGGSDPEFEELIRMAKSEATQPVGMAPIQPAPPVAPTEQGRATMAAPATADPNGFTLTVGLASAAQVAPQATLFVFLRPESGGPPVAAKRISMPTFPLTITIGTEDSMMGDELPSTGTLIARLDGDGNVASANADDLQAEVLATKGEIVQLTLGE